jgi:hypothetical protein
MKRRSQIFFCIHFFFALLEYFSTTSMTSDASEENRTIALADPSSFLGGGLLIHPDLFVRTDFRLFC